MSDKTDMNRHRLVVIGVISGSHILNGRLSQRSKNENDGRSKKAVEAGVDKQRRNNEKSADKQR